MNVKLLFPTYRNRYRFVERSLELLRREGKTFPQALNIGTGEGDYDPMIAVHTGHLIGTDINEGDITHARRMNEHLPSITYRVEDAMNLSFADKSQDLVVSVDVLEHVPDAQRMMTEVSRVLTAGGYAVVTFPSTTFPITYDPINFFRQRAGKKPFSIGAYAFGHDHLIDPAVFRSWVGTLGLEVVREEGLSGYLIGILEMYWTGFIQKIFKANTRNLSTEEKGNSGEGYRPTTDVPKLVILTDAIIALDRALSSSFYGFNRGFILRKKG